MTAAPPTVGVTPPSNEAEHSEPRTRVPWRIAARLARRDVRRNPGRTALVAGLLALPLAFATLWLVAYAMQTQPARPEDRLDPGIEARLYWGGGPVLQAGPDLTDHVRPAAEVEAPTWSEARQRLEAALPGAAGWATGALLDGYVPGDGGGTRTQARAYLTIGAGGGVLHGRAPTGPDEALVAAGSGWERSESVTLVVDDEERPFAVVGTYAPAPGTARTELWVGPGSVELDLDTLQLSIVSPSVTWDDVVRLNAAGFMGYARSALLDPPTDAEVPFFVQGHTLRSQGPEGLGGDTAVVALGLAALLLVIVLVVGPAQVVGVRRSTRTYALLAATGADARTLRWVVLLGAVLQGLVAAVVGISVGLLVALTLHKAAPNALGGEGVSLVMPWVQLAGIGLLSVALVLVSALAPARTASRTDVVRVLAGRRGDAPPARRTPVIGLGLVGLGLALGTWAVLGTSAVAVVGALVAVVVGLLMCAGGLVVGVARVLAPRAPLPVRLALRDAVRHRSRSVAAVTAVTAAAAILVGASLAVASDTAHFQAVRSLSAGHGMVVTYINPDVVDAVPAVEELERAVLATDPGARVVRVLALGATRTGFDRPVRLDWEDGTLDVAPNPALTCPSALPGAETTADEYQRLVREDPRCAAHAYESYGTSWSSWTFIDDGTWTGATGLPGAETAATALAAGRAVVADASVIQDDGTITVRLVPAGDVDPQTITSTSVPATHVPGFIRTGYETVLPPDVAEGLGLAGAPIGTITRPSSPDLADAVMATARGAVGNRGWSALEDDRASSAPALTAGILGASFVLGIGTAALVLLLVAGEVRADLAVLSAVGAAPRTRRSLLAAQSGALVAIGTALGAAVGIVGVAGYVALSARKSPGFVDPSWTLAVPWPQLAGILVLLPVGAWLTGWLTTRSRLPAPSDVR